AHLIIGDALAVADAGCFAVVLEAVPRELAALITEKIRIPTIGIGAGPDCDGQILVLHDVLGLSERTPRFVKTWADISGQVVEALEAYRKEVSSGSFPDDSHSFHMDKSILEDL
ncbi:MAG: 3-methyl-2-oxobutanoate hydroxymethyltransferase, partial [Candidatus Glassbacteria bacterium]|nr:3-methyl-2-oxobutanoate hydroxymethyltransferase [Candidatus Glassbacteria bacterium]